MIKLVVALASEARPLVEHFDLARRGGKGGFHIFTGNEAALVVTGIGKVNAAAGSAYLAGFVPGEDQAWLNIGIAGHETFSPGTGTHASRITDNTTGRSWYPPKIVRMPGLGVHITSYDQPVTHYPPVMACEMEASAFYSVATRFSPGEIVQCYKIVSDNSEESKAGITPASVENLINDHLAAIDGFAASLVELAGQLLPADCLYREELNELRERWHFTVTQTVQLGESLRKMVVRGVGEKIRLRHWQHCVNAKQVLAEMESLLKSLPVVL